jgi:hypothetical protein
MLLLVEVTVTDTKFTLPTALLLRARYCAETDNTLLHEDLRPGSVVSPTAQSTPRPQERILKWGSGLDPDSDHHQQRLWWSNKHTSNWSSSTACYPAGLERSKTALVHRKW